ncbi:hypothetical protein [Nosocomiicoccus ampullae]|uniref:Flagellar biosynthesis GTPase FlhF n=1 Tax=Nosocomiicoccus ampullae TaxID=489910 RepID=A0A9Q2HEN2_9STAP|nr:hypothetical protein [Nosocomiicoccus ampullae]MBB5175509.1 flagellar biosynthesis GTPase FlhF [Nosocomiicoccus ampullae]QYA46916.1 hypothetical protein KPF49_00210 [Nosocomiicoccus ampullae]
MKKKFGFLSLIMILTLVACSNDNDAELVSENVVERKASEDTEETDKEKEEAEEKNTHEKENERDNAKENDETKERQQKAENKKGQKNKEKESTIAVKQYTDEEKQEMTEIFYEWAVERAEIGAMAVTDYYFGHGAGGRGDWAARTPHGIVQAQDLNNPGWEAFELHAIGGVAFYQPITEDYGRDEDHPDIIIASGYSTIAKPDTDIHKYMLVDNGIVYELIGPLGLSTGFSEYTDDGEITDIIKYNIDEFKVSQDQAAQEEWRRILSLYE